MYTKGTVKTRWDLKFLYPLGSGTSDLVPISERFFLGGETTVRGYEPFRIGPKFKDKEGATDNNDPMGGVSSALFSIEYLQNILPMLDLFIFFDSGSISMHTFDIPQFRMSYGAGARIELANRIPIILGIGQPINPESPEDVKKFFISMGGQF